MAAAVGLVITKEFLYRGVAEQWSNKYWLTGADPGPATSWRTLFDQLVVLEKACYSPLTSVVGGYGYNDNADGAHAVWSVDLKTLSQTVVGTLVVDPTAAFAGDQAGMVEWQTQRKNARGKWVYLRKYFHGGGISSTNADQISPATMSAYDAVATALLGGTWPGGRKIRSQRQDETFNWGARSSWVTTRTLKRRGKRP